MRASRRCLARSIFAAVRESIAFRADGEGHRTSEAAKHTVRATTRHGHIDELAIRERLLPVYTEIGFQRTRSTEGRACGLPHENTSGAFAPKTGGCV